MTDLDRFLSLMNDAGIRFQVLKGEEAETIEPDENEPDTLIAVVIGDYSGFERHHPSVEGYNGFHCKFHFDAGGKLFKVGVWE